MKALGRTRLKVVDIIIGERLRQIDEGHAQLLAENIQQTGHLRQPPEVRQQRKGKSVTHTLISGGHRMRAVQIVGWDEVDVEVFEGTDDEVRMYEIDENLIRHDLNPLDRAVFMAERKAIYLRLHPETKHGAQGGVGGKMNENDTMSFSKNTAEKCGWTARTIERAVYIAERLGPDIRARIAGTWLAKNQAQLLALAKPGPEMRSKILDAMFRAENPAANVAAALAEIEGRRTAETTATDVHFAKLLSAWTRADRAGRKAFLEHLKTSGQIADLLGDEE